VLVAICEVNYNGSPTPFPTITVTDTAGGTWTPVPGATLSVFADGTLASMLWRPVPTAPGSITATMHRGSDATAAMLAMAVRVCNGANLSNPVGASNTASGTSSGSSLTIAASITPQQVGSLVYAAGMHADTNADTVSGVTAILGQADTPDGGYIAIGKTGPTVSLATLTPGWTATPTSGDGWMAATLEIVPASVSAPSSPPRLIAPGWQAPSRLAPTLPPPPALPSVTITPTAGLSGAGQLGATGTDVKQPTAGLFGQGNLTAFGETTGAQLFGQGQLGATGVDVKHAAVTMAGAGSLAATETMASLDGEGFLGAAGAFTTTVVMAGTGTLGITGWTHGYAVVMAGAGSLGAYEQVQYSALFGQGNLGITGEGLGYVAGLFGQGSLSIPQVAGGLVNGVGGAGTPLALPGSSQVAVAPPGSSNWQWVGTIGQVTALTYSYVCPGGCDKMSLTLMVPASYRNQMFSPGWQVKITRGGHQVWEGKLDEPQSSPSGWTLTAVGTGNRGADFTAFYSPGDTWPTGVPDDIINRAISRGLPWINPGLAGNPNASQFWMGQQFDPGSQNVAAFLSLLCTRGGLTWYVNSQPGGYPGSDLNIFPLPTTVNRLLVCTTPVSRTLGGDINYIVIKYQATADNTTASPPVAATYNYVAALNQQSINTHQEMETYIDLSDVGVQTSTQAQAIGNYVLQIYQRASFAGPFHASYGQLLTTGGQPIDPGTDQAGTVVQLILTDFGYGGEVTPQFPISFIVGAYEWDDFAQVATVTPYQNVDQSLTGLLSLENTLLKPI
jgi:hypothetical protein